jgi:hypothetical protein
VAAAAAHRVEKFINSVEEEKKPFIKVEEEYWKEKVSSSISELEG